MAKDDVVMKLDANTAAFVEAIRRAQDKMQSFTDTAEKTGPKVDKLGSMVLKLEKSFGNLNPKDFGVDLANAFELPLTPIGAMETALNSVKTVLTYIWEESGKAAENLKKLDAPAKSLIQTSATLGEFKQSRQQARDLASKYGMDPKVAMDLMVSAKNRQMEKHAETFASATFVQSPDKMVDAVADVRESFGEKAGDPRQVMNKLLFAASKSKLDLETFSPEAVKAAPLVSQIGGNSDELLAMMGRGANYFGRGEKAADRINRGASELQQAGFGGKGSILKCFDEYMKASGQSEKDMLELANIDKRRADIDKRQLEIDKEASTKRGGKRTRSMEKEYDALQLEERELGLRANTITKGKLRKSDSSEFAEFKGFMLTMRKEIEEDIKGVREAGEATPGKDLFSEKVAMMEGDSEESAKLALKKSEAELENASATTFGEGRLKTDAVINRQKSKSIERGESGATRFLREKGAQGAQVLGAGEAGVEAAGEVVPLQTKMMMAGPGAGTVLVVEALERIYGAVTGQTKALETRKGTALENNSEGQK